MSISQGTRRIRVNLLVGPGDFCHRRSVLMTLSDVPQVGQEINKVMMSKIVQKSCPEGVWGPRLRKTSEENV